MEMLKRAITGFIFVALIALLCAAPPFLFTLFLIFCFLWILLVEWTSLVPSLNNRIIFFSFFYIATGFGILIVLNSNPTQRLLIPAIFALSCVHDTAAYITGRLLGRYKLCPSLSPGKTWEGFFGGLAGVTVLCCITQSLLSSGYQNFLELVSVWGIDGGAFVFWHRLFQAPALVLVLFCTGVAVSATSGDLFESYLKRKAGIKDSGSLLPGHGGLFDRFDSILAVTCWVYVWFRHVCS